MNQETHQLTFKQEIDRINVSAYDEFNWFRVMYKMTEERSLHSRFIAFLLNPKGSHGQGDTFLKLFLEEFNVTGFELDGVRVLPDEQEKREADNIDVLITNKRQQAILIENKIFAGDSNKHDVLVDEIGDGTQVPDPRYYHRITNKGFAVTHIFYLTVKFNKPSYYDEFPDEVKAVLHFRDYIKSIIDWVGKCIDAYGTDDVFRGGLEQYQQAMIGFLNDYRLALDLKAISARYPEEAFAFWNTRNEADTARDKIIKDQFMHVKWHAVHEFYSKLKIGMEKSFGVAVSDIGNEEITAVTHRGSKTRTALGFAYKGKTFYVCNDRKGFSVGVDKVVKAPGDFSVLSGTTDYAFLDFSERKVFELLDPERNDALVDRLLEELTLFMNETNH